MTVNDCYALSCEGLPDKIADRKSKMGVAADGRKRMTPVVEWPPALDSGASYMGAHPPRSLGGYDWKAIA